MEELTKDMKYYAYYREAYGGGCLERDGRIF